jgi:hypothetical protein
MEFLPGGSLDAILSKREISPENPLDFVDFYHYARGIAIGSSQRTATRFQA